ncbi:MAG: DUF1801 domain-containing protein [Deltaproteobacteria bacterium]|nr:DUF1801 domain-containing protein [Deltaproteobacteria bacterium]
MNVRKPATQQATKPATQPAKRRTTTNVRKPATQQARKPTTKPTTKAAAKAGAAKTPSQLIDGRIAELADWRGELLGRLRALVKAADPEIVEEWKWRGVPVWSHDGIVCTGETYKAVVKMTFAHGAALPDPRRLFNSSLEGNTRRAIDFHEGGKVDAEALVALVRAAVAYNTAKG